MYGAIDSNDQYELKMIQTQCWLCGLSIEVWRGIHAYCSACLQDNPKELETYKNILKVQILQCS